MASTAKTCLNGHSQKDQKWVSRMQVKSITELEHSAILSPFIKLPFVIKIFVLSMFEWPQTQTVWHTDVYTYNLKKTPEESKIAISFVYCYYGDIFFKSSYLHDFLLYKQKCVFYQGDG